MRSLSHTSRANGQGQVTQLQALNIRQSSTTLTPSITLFRYMMDPAYVPPSKLHHILPSSTVVSNLCLTNIYTEGGIYIRSVFTFFFLPCVYSLSTVPFPLHLFPFLPVLWIWHISVCCGCIMRKLHPAAIVFSVGPGNSTSYRFPQILKADLIGAVSAHY